MGGTRKIGFLADTHSTKPDGSDLPDQVLRAFKGTDLIIHLGDIGRHGILDRLADVAPVMVPSGDGKGYIRRGSDDAPVKVLEAGELAIGLAFNLTQPDKKIVINGATPDFGDAPLDALLNRRFKRPVDVVAFGGTHLPYEGVHEAVLFFNPGSPTLPSGDVAGVAMLDVSGKKPKVKLVAITA